MNSKNELRERKGAEAVVAVFVLALLTTGAARAQDSGSSDSSSSSSSSSGSSFGSSDMGGGSSFGSSDSSGFGGTSSTGAAGAPGEKSAAELPAPNSLSGLFTPQPQYPSPGKTIMNPETIPQHLGDDSKQPGRQPTSGGTVYSNDFGKHESSESETKNKDNPLKGLFQQQPQYPSPGKTIMFPEAVPKHVGDDSAVPGRQPGQAGTVYSNDWGKDSTEASGNKDNVLKGLFVQQPQYPSPNKTIMTPDNIPQQLGDDSSQRGRQPGQAGTAYQPPSVPTLEEEAAAAAAAVLKATPAAATKSSESEKKEGEGDKKDADKKEGDKEKGDKEKGEKDKEGEKKDADKKDGDKDAKKDGDKKEYDKKDTEKDKDKKDADKKDEKKDSILTGLDSDKEKKEGEEKKADDKKADADKDKDKKDADKKEEKKEEKKLEPKAAEYHPIREAIILMNSKNYKASAEILDKLIAKNPGYAQAIYTRAVLNVMQRKYDQAVADYNAVLKIIPVGGELRALAEKGLNKLHFQSPYTGK